MSGMVVSEIMPLTGHAFNTDDIMSVNAHTSLQRYDFMGQKLIYYFDNVSDDLRDMQVKYRAPLIKTTICGLMQI